MIKNKFLKTAMLITVIMLSCSCNKFLTLRPQDGITRDQFWKTKEQLQAAVIACYNYMLVAPSGDKAPAEYFFIWGEIRADMIIPGPGMTADETNIVNANILSSNTLTKWQAFYNVINLCNNILDFGPGVKSADPTLTDAQLNANLAEALTIRSLMYFYLVRTFGDVPLKLTSTSSDSQLVQLPKTNRSDILKQITDDLTKAEGYALITYGDKASDKGRVTKFTVNALQADVYLWMDNYANCIAACDKVINSGKFGLVAGDSGWFTNLFVNGNSGESIFELQFDAQNLNPYFSMFSDPKKSRYKANPDIIDNFYTVDPLDDKNKDIRGIDVAIHVSDQSIYKYAALSGGTNPDIRTTDVSYAHWMVYRYADILLMKAEACANSNRGQETLDLINQIRFRARALPTSAQNPDVTNVAGLTDYLLAERAREFAFEGKRWYDLLRNAKRNNYARLDILTQAVLSVVPPQVQQSALNKLKDPNSHYLPFFINELQTDPNLVQNPFYK